MKAKFSAATLQISGLVLPQIIDSFSASNINFVFSSKYDFKFLAFLYKKNVLLGQRWINYGTFHNQECQTE